MNEQYKLLPYKKKIIRATEDDGFFGLLPKIV